MDCARVRDRFSSLWEKELMAPEEKTVKEHLSSCQECQKEFERFEKTMGWLRAVGDVEVPQEFLPELYKKMDERRKALRVEKSRRKWSILPPSFKIPAQAVAMVAIVFFVLYLTQMMPTEVFRPRDAEQTSSPLSGAKKNEQVYAQKKRENGKMGLEIPAETLRRKDIEHLQPPALGEKKVEDIRIAQAKEEAKNEEAPGPKSEMMASQKIESKEAAEARIPVPEADKLEKGLVAKEKTVAASKPPKEIFLRVSDREKVVPQLHELVKQFGGEMVITEGNMFLASLPTDSIPEFEKEVVGLSAPTQTDKVIAKKQIAGSLGAGPGKKREEVDEKSKAPAKLAAGPEGRTIIRILLVQE